MALHRLTCATMLFGLLALARPQTSSGTSQPIRLDPRNSHYFLFRGKTVALITSGEHYGAVLNADFDYRKYLDTLQSDGLNYTRLFPGSYVEVPAKSFGIRRNDLAPAEGKFIAPWARSTVPAYAGGGNKFDLSQWNPAYFSRLHDFLSEAAKRGIVVEISLFSSQYGQAQWALSPFNPANNVNNTDAIDWKLVNTLDNGSILACQEHYVRKIVREVNAFDNVIFELQNEPFADRPVLEGVVNPYLFPPARNQFPNTIETADDKSIAWQTRVAKWITGEEASLANKHLIAQNYCDFGLPVIALIPGVSIVNFHYAYPQAASANYGLGKMLAYDETGFLGRDDAAYRRQAWNFLLSGGGAFDGLDYSFSVGYEDGSDAEPNGPGGGSAAFRKQLGILSQLMRSLPLAYLAPDIRTVKHANGAYAHVLSNPRKEYAIYLDGNSPGDVTLDLPPGTYSGEWINTQSGQATEIKFDHAGADKLLHPPSADNGIALHLVRTSR